MPDEKNQPTASDVLRSLHEMIAGPEQNVDLLTREDVLAELKRRGIETKQLKANVRKQLATARGDAQLSAARIARALVLARLKKTSANEKSDHLTLREHALAILNKLSIEKPTVAAAYFSKFDEASTEDLRSLIDDLESLDELKRNDGPGQT